MARRVVRDDYFNHFCQRGGDYSREVINRGTAITQGNMVLKLPDTRNIHKILKIPEKRRQRLKLQQHGLHTLEGRPKLYKCFQVWPSHKPRWGRGVLNKINVHMGRLRPEVWTPYPFIYHFSRKRYPFRIPSITECYPFHIPCLEFCTPFNCCKCTVF